MNKKEILRKVFLVFPYLWFSYCTVNFLLKPRDMVNIITMVICCFLIIIYSISIVRAKLAFYKTYKEAKVILKCMQVIQKERYVYYISGDKENEEDYSDIINVVGTNLIILCEKIISNKLLGKKLTSKFEEILKQTKKLMTDDISSITNS